jgi:hypothetical protein
MSSVLTMTPPLHSNHVHAAESQRGHTAVVPNVSYPDHVMSAGVLSDKPIAKVARQDGTLVAESKRAAPMLRRP